MTNLLNHYKTYSAEELNKLKEHYINECNERESGTMFDLYQSRIKDIETVLEKRGDK